MAQGVRSLVPATVRGGAAGPGSSLSNDCGMVGPALTTPSGGKKRSAASPLIPLNEWIEVRKKAERTKKKTRPETVVKKKNIA